MWSPAKDTHTQAGKQNAKNKNHIRVKKSLIDIWSHIHVVSVKVKQ